MRRKRTRVVVGAVAVALLWLGLVLPHLLGAWPQVLVFVGIVVAAAWGWGKVAKARAPAASSVDAMVDAVPERELADR
jgi:Na+/H+ antiporter NhaC